MVQILPMEDRERERQLLQTVETVGGEPRILVMADRSQQLGWVAVEVDRGVLRILKFTAGLYDFSQKPQGETSFILDTLLRSAASYGETKGAGFIETAFPDFFGFFKARGFDTDECRAFGPMNLIVKYE